MSSHLNPVSIHPASCLLQGPTDPGPQLRVGLAAAHFAPDVRLHFCQLILPIDKVYSIVDYRAHETVSSITYQVSIMSLRSQSPFGNAKRHKTASASSRKAGSFQYSATSVDSHRAKSVSPEGFGRARGIGGGGGESPQLVLRLTLMCWLLCSVLLQRCNSGIGQDVSFSSDRCKQALKWSSAEL